MTPISRRVFIQAFVGLTLASHRMFEKTGWPPQWVASIYDFHHYHSTAHEVLGCVSGSAKLMLGGPNGHEVMFKAGDRGALLREWV